MDVWMLERREAEMYFQLDHHLFLGRCCLKLKKYNIGSQKTSYKYNIQMLKEDEQQLVEEENQTVVKQSVSGHE